MVDSKIDKEWSVYKIEYAKSIIGIEDKHIMYISDTGTSKVENVYIFVKYELIINNY